MCLKKDRYVGGVGLTDYRGIGVGSADVSLAQSLVSFATTGGSHERVKEYGEYVCGYDREVWPCTEFMKPREIRLGPWRVVYHHMSGREQPFTIYGGESVYGFAKDIDEVARWIDGKKATARSYTSYVRRTKDS